MEFHSNTKVSAIVAGLVIELRKKVASFTGGRREAGAGYLILGGLGI
jgi:hypothetical protein